MFSLYSLSEVALGSFHHCNLQLKSWLDQVLSFVLITPNLHHIHHSNNQNHFDSNFGSVLSIWDRLGGSYLAMTENDRKELKFGVIQRDQANSPLTSTKQMENDGAFTLATKKFSRNFASYGLCLLVVLSTDLWLPTKLLNRPHNGGKVITVQPIRVCETNGERCASVAELLDLESEAKKIFASAGISFVFLPIVELRDSRFIEPTVIRTKDYPEGTPTDSAHILVRGQGHLQHPDWNVINFYLVSRLRKNDGGDILGFGLTNASGLIVATDQLHGSKDILAHELGHNLGLTHSEDANNLMKHAGRSKLNLLTQTQVDTLQYPLFTVRGTRVSLVKRDLEKMDSKAWDFSFQGPAHESLSAIRFRYLDESILEKMQLTGQISGCNPTHHLTRFDGGGVQLEMQFPNDCFVKEKHYVVKFSSGYIVPFSIEYIFKQGTMSWGPIALQ